jgi:hypothetical protein
MSPAYGDGLRVRGSVFMRKGFVSRGEVRLVGAVIDGNLECDGARLSNPGGKTLNVQGARIGGSAYFRSGFVSEGEMRLLGMIVTGSFSCRGGKFSNAGGIAIAAERAELNGGAFLDNGFQSDGEVRFGSARIRGGLDCGAAHFSNPHGRAFHGDSIRVEDSVFFRNSIAAGEIRLVSAIIGRNVEFDGATLQNPGGKALVLNGSEIGGNAFLRSGLKVAGEIDLAACNIAGHFVLADLIDTENIALDLTSARALGLSDDASSWPKQGKLLLDGFCYERIMQLSPLDAATRREWLNRQPRDTFWPQPYEQLANVLRTMGHDSDARQLMIAKGREQARFTRRFRQSWGWYNVFGRFIGYGYAPWRAFAASA